MIRTYPNDINDNCINELHQCHAKAYVESCSDDGNCNVYSHQDLYDVDIIIKDGVQNVFPNVEVVLRISLCLMVTNFTAERSFSQLKNIKLSTNNDERRQVKFTKPALR